MSSHPFMPLYVDDYEAATTHLTVEEDGVYSRLLRLCWRTPGCCLPNDPAWIARKIRLSQEDFERVAKPVLDEFFTVVRGCLTQKRLREEYNDVTRRRSARSEAGKKGGRAKALKNQENGSGNATTSSEQSPSSHNHIHNHIQNQSQKEDSPPSDPPTANVLPFERPEALKPAAPPERADRAPTAKGSRLAADWRPSDDDRACAKNLGFGDGDIVRIAEGFRDYWIAQPGAKGRKTDWAATWRNWVRREAERKPPKPKQVDWC